MQELKVALDAAEKAGEVLTSLFGKVKDVRKKAKADYVTEADIAAEEVIIATLKRVFPSDKIHSEELYPNEKFFDNTWVIDGLDGTNNYVTGLPLYGTNIACYRNNRCIAAVVGIPMFKEVYWASRDNEGAFMNKKRIYVSTQDTLEYSGGAITTATLRNPGLLERLTPVLFSSGRIRSTGAACYDSVLVARGVFDYRVSFPEKPVDIAAPYYIIEKAGGVATNLDGNTLTLDGSEWLASNGKLHRRLVALLNQQDG